MFRVTCLQCSQHGALVLYEGTGGDDVAIHWPIAGGLRTPNTPGPVAYYLDQAARCESVNARSAAVSMYRAALEQLLFEQGYIKGMLNQKIQDLDAAITAGTAPKWARDLPVDFLRVIKNLGNGAIHPNGGDITKQDAFDLALLGDVATTIAMLLEVVYEEPTRQAALLARLKGAATKVG